MNPDDYCRDKAAPPGSSVHYSLLGLPDPKRRALTALHAWRRELAEVAQNNLDTGVARAKLDWWRAELERLSQGKVQHPVTRALAAPARDFGLARDLFQQTLEAAAMDLDYDVYPSFAALLPYCHRAGSAMSLLRSQVLGYREARTATFAHELGIALLCVRFVAELRDDARRGRFYIPEDECARFGVAHADLLQAQTTEPLRALLALQAERARDFWRRAQAALPAEDRQAQRSQLVLGELALAELAAIEADGFRVLERRVELTPLCKFWIARRALRRARAIRPADAVQVVPAAKRS